MVTGKTVTNTHTFMSIQTIHVHKLLVYNMYNKCKNIFTKMLNDVGIEMPKSIETRSKFSMHADKGRG